MLALFLLGSGSIALIACPTAVAAYRLADRIWLERMTRTPWDDVHGC
jgi:hypothetical protein